MKGVVESMSRNGSEWREAQRVQTDRLGLISCALSDSRVLIGGWRSTYMELFRVESGPRIARVHRIRVPEEYRWFSATCGSDTLERCPTGTTQCVCIDCAATGWVNSRASNLCVPLNLLRLADRLLVADYDENKQSNAIIELEVSDTRLERRRELIATSENFHVKSLCAMNDGVAIFDDKSKDILCTTRLLRN